ncbi:hypothetical protein ACWDYJ_18715 [Streptomyces sp. NPDC003042]
MEYNQGDRVQYTGPDKQKHTGQIQRVQNESSPVKYIIKDEQTKKEQQIDEAQIQRGL